MSILQAKEVMDAVASSSTRRLKRRRRYINCNRETAHFRLRHDYFDDDYVYPVILPPKISYADNSFPKHYV
jgi:hypothetical protein